ncbi:DUF4406 domain-containing protein [Alicyclobacillus dauci]|uniref:DUF4406 domain-containing protein n=1 Tax=Alicyclobacillus dauci TaxID=1475485 RepID=A0ABY6Z2X6_9BACL|nr:DUF4406 domain-containing protein [Alicyclobacillus dauci]WAH37242.1 DUF4406 domain-containing protein [Alicyclobacillus dauci]
MKNIYLSGPMTGLADFNRPAFDAAASALRSLGFTVVSPAEQAIAGGEWEDYMRHDLVLMMSTDSVVTLPGWRQSRGASLEVYIAHQLKMPVYELETVLLQHGMIELESSAQQLSLNL